MEVIIVQCLKDFTETEFDKEPTLNFLLNTEMLQLSPSNNNINDDEDYYSTLSPARGTVCLQRKCYQMSQHSKSRYKANS